MNITIETIKIIFFALPGIVCLFIFNRLLGLGAFKRTPYTDTLKVIVFSFLSHYISAVLFKSTSLDGAISGTFSIVPTDVILTCTAGVLLAFMLSYLYNYNVLHRIAGLLRASNHYGDEDVWHFFHNVPEKQKNDGYIYVRDLENKITYYGYVVAHSDSDQKRELLLSNVSVYDNERSDNDNNPMYTMKMVYLDAISDKMILQVPEDQPEPEPLKSWRVFRIFGVHFAIRRLYARKTRHPCKDTGGPS